LPFDLLPLVDQRQELLRNLRLTTTNKNKQQLTMSSASNITDSSSVPAETTPSFFRRITNAYGAAIAELLSPSPSSSPRRAGRPPDPTEADPGLYPNVTYRARLPPP
jgi:hypothetical protein